MTVPATHNVGAAFELALGFLEERAPPLPSNPRAPGQRATPAVRTAPSGCRAGVQHAGATCGVLAPLVGPLEIALGLLAAAYPTTLSDRVLEPDEPSHASPRLTDQRDSISRGSLAEQDVKRDWWLLGCGSVVGVAVTSPRRVPDLGLAPRRVGLVSAHGAAEEGC